MTQIRKYDKPELYSVLKEMYDNNGLYNDKRKTAINDNKWLEALRPLRTVSNRSVEFFVAKVFPTTRPVFTSANDNILEPLKSIAKWSNFAGKKQLYLRNMSIFGDLFLKIVVNNGKVYYESINPQNVTDFEADSRGFLQWIRIDIPLDELSTFDSGESVFDDQAISSTTKSTNLTYTEYWSKKYFAIWIHNQGANAQLDTLGDPKDFGFPSEFGIDFVPFVHIKFRDTGDKYGRACFEHAIDKIDEANRKATRLAQILFRYNKPLWAVLSNSVDKDGLALPAPRLKEGDGKDTNITDNSIIYLPGKADIKSLIPPINYDAALGIINSDMDEIEQDLPELRYYSLKEGSLSGKAIALLLGGALDRAIEARSNFIQGLMRANQMALTLGRNMNIFDKGIGDFTKGHFEHTIVMDSIFAEGLDERAITLKALTESGVPVQFAMKQTGFSEEEVKEAFETLEIKE